MLRRRLAAALLMTTALFAVAAADAGARYAMRGFVVKVDPSRRSFVVSHDSVPGVMAAMTMPFDVRDPKELQGVEPGMTWSSRWSSTRTPATSSRFGFGNMRLPSRIPSPPSASRS
jgi:Cu/Ag efflux protein CusF